MSISAGRWGTSCWPCSTRRGTTLGAIYEEQATAIQHVGQFFSRERLFRAVADLVAPELRDDQTVRDARHCPYDVHLVHGPPLASGGRALCGLSGDRGAANDRPNRSSNPLAEAVRSSADGFTQPPLLSTTCPALSLSREKRA